MEKLEKTLLKKTPCDECRRRKRKCSYEQPCQRCTSLNMECIYTVIAPPADLEYMHQLEQIEQVKTLESQLVAMEKELASLKLTSQKQEAYQHIQFPSPVSMETRDNFPFEPSSNKQLKENHHQLIAQSNNVTVFVSPPKRKKESFALTINKGGIVINTFIQSHQDLLDSLHDILCTLGTDTTVPSSFTQLPSDFNVSAILTSLLAKSYSKQWIKSITKSMPLKKELEYLAVNKYAIPSDKIVMTTFQLIHGYIKCLHLTQFYIHVPYLMTHFVQPDQPSCNILSSPAVMALCSTICLQACHHISAIIPPHSSTCYALYYFERARELVSDRFDECSLEIMLTYAFMAFYKFKLRENLECLKYINMGDRICSILAPLYNGTTITTMNPDTVMFHRTHRLIRYIHHTASVYEAIKRGNPYKYEGRRNFSELLEGNDISTVMFSDQDTFEEKEFIHLIQLRLQLQQSLHSIIHRHPNSTTLTTHVGELSHQMEMAMRYWYRNVLPERYQMSLPLFENKLVDVEYFIVLERECGERALAPRLLCLIYLYNEYLVVGKAYVPKKPNELQPTVNQLLDYSRRAKLNHTRKAYTATPKTSLRWEKLILRIAHFKRDQQLDEFEGTEADYIEKLITCVHPEEWNFDMPVARISVLAAIHIVRLVQYLMTKDYSCFLDYKWLMNAWDMLLRASRFKCSLPEQGITLDRIRANLLLCMNIIRDHSVHEKVEGVDLMLEKLEREFNDSV